MLTIINFIQRAILQGTPLLYGATGEILTEKSGNLNLGIPGIMYIGAISGVVGGFLYQTSTEEVIPILCGLNLLNLQAKLFQQFDLSLDRLTVGINSITLLKNLDQLCSCQEMFLISLFI